ncbi:MAG TPA: asparaginase [Nitratifractor sp.]|nr:asparaginase [Nitratifractor sp.]HHH20737.1 asparaginase [Nitratifractor sp.]
MNSILILSTGGTFNKVYNRKTGRLDIDPSFKAFQTIQESWLSNFNFDSIIHKDSLEFTDKDRETLKSYLQATSFKKIAVVHGTDTIDKSAKFIADANLEKQIVFTGAMVPFSINPLEATANLASAIGFLYGSSSNSVSIAINGRVNSFDKVVKNREAGYFELYSN